MASIQKTTKGYRAFVYVKGVRDTKQFATKREASAWAAQRETEIRGDAQKSPAEKHTLADALSRYKEEESPRKRGHRWESVRIEALLRDPNFPSRVSMCNLTPTHFSEWRDARTKEVQPGTVLREISLISGVLECARVEWQWIDSNPMKLIRKPKMPDHREVIITPAQTKAMLKAMRYSPASPVRTVAQSVSVCFLTALRTGMRAGELTGLTWDRVFDDHVFLPVTKTTKRNAPLTHKAVRLIQKMRDYDPESVFGLTSQSLDANFRKYRVRAGLSGFTFHDSRHTAATQMARKLDVLDLCRVFGWTDPKMAMVYYNPTASSIADILNAKK